MDRRVVKRQTWAGHLGHTSPTMAVRHPVIDITEPDIRFRVHQTWQVSILSLSANIEKHRKTPPAPGQLRADKSAVAEAVPNR